MMDNIFSKNIINIYIYIYNDDILVFSYTFQEHIKHLEFIFEELISHELIVSKKKLKLFKTQIEFLGDPVYFQERTSEILNNLRCPKLQDFKWYENMFLVKVMARPDCESHYWKENLYQGYPLYLLKKLNKKLEMFIMEEFLMNH